MRRAIIAVGLALVVLLAGCHPKAMTIKHITLDKSLAPLRTAFNADAGKVRAILLGSPVCPDCLRGAADIESAWLKKHPNEDVVVYMIWSPQLGAEEKNVAAAAQLIADPRVTDYWDPNMLAGTAFLKTLLVTNPLPPGVKPAPLWDFYMLFGPNARWPKDQPPTPAWWEHQLGGLPPARRLDANRFAKKTAALLARPVPKQ